MTAVAGNGHVDRAGHPHRPALLLIGHGSRDPQAADEFASLLELVRVAVPDRLVGGGFLELADPPIDGAVDDLVAQGATDVVAVPYVLFGAGHLKDDGPAVLARARHRHPAVRFRLARDLGIHPAAARHRRGAGPHRGRASPATPRPWSWSDAARPTPTPAPTTSSSCGCSATGGASASSSPPSSA